MPGSSGAVGDESSGGWEPRCWALPSSGGWAGWFQLPPDTPLPLPQLPERFGAVRTIAEGAGGELLVGTTRNAVLRGGLAQGFVPIVQVMGGIATLGGALGGWRFPACPVHVPSSIWMCCREAEWAVWGLWGQKGAVGVLGGGG